MGVPHGRYSFLKLDPSPPFPIFDKRNAKKSDKESTCDSIPDSHHLMYKETTYAL